LIQSFDGRPAIVAAVAIGEDANPAIANDRAPIVVSIKYLSMNGCWQIADRLQVASMAAIGRG
jgi:hypothetical protein